MPLSAQDIAWIDRLDQYLMAHLADPTLSVTQVAKALDLSESTLLRKVKQLTGLTPQAYLLRLRVDTGCRLLVSKSYPSIREISEAVGYRNPQTFARNVKAQTGRLPSDWWQGGDGTPPEIA